MPENNDIETRPYENEHACRLRNPGDFQEGSFRRTKRKHEDKEYSVIMGKLKGESAMTEQAYRYKKATWTAQQARSHCKEHKGTFEAARDSKSDRTEDPMERRIIAFEQTELRVDDDKPMLIGYAARSGVFTDLGWFREKIKPGAFSEVLKDDVRCLKNHDPNLILGRTTNETLRIEENTVGLHYENDLPDTNTGRDVREEVRRRDITGCSFSFIVGEDQWKYFDDDRPPERTIIKLKRLFDVGPVTYPAYPDTTVAARSLEHFKAEQETRDEEKDDSPQEEPQKDDSEEIENKKKDQERQRELRRKYHEIKRMIARNKPAES